MTKEEAKAAIERGDKVTHEYFSDNEWVTVSEFHPAYYKFEDGIQQRSGDFWEMRNFSSDWNDGWSIYNE